MADPTTTPNPEIITKPGGNNNPQGVNQHSSKGGQPDSYKVDQDRTKGYGTNREYLAKKVAAIANPEIAKVTLVTLAKMSRKLILNDLNQTEIPDQYC